MPRHLVLFVFSALLGVPMGAAGVADALSCRPPSVNASLEVVSVIYDGNVRAEDPEAVAPAAPVLRQADYGQAALDPDADDALDDIWIEEVAR
ncbi:MAG: hypothetical protein VYE22_29155 [Myxococcota bacterium]|nr:hypothetical protein [Myxococcota bacterium]